jgi:hypothetical protein
LRRLLVTSKHNLHARYDDLCITIPINASLIHAQAVSPETTAFIT